MTTQDGTNDGRRDFDFFHGRWRIHNRRLKKRLAGSTEWEEFDCPEQACWPILGGQGNVDEFIAPVFPGPDGRPLFGATFRLFDPTTRLWSLYWADDRTHVLQPPVVGRFTEGRGVFLGDDVFDGKPIRVRYIWGEITPSSARWEQAFSPDGEKTWETNWVMRMTRLG